MFTFFYEMFVTYVTMKRIITPVVKFATKLNDVVDCHSDAQNRNNALSRSLFDSFILSIYSYVLLLSTIVKNRI